MCGAIKKNQSTIKNVVATPPSLLLFLHVKSLLQDAKDYL